MLNDRAYLVQEGSATIYPVYILKRAAWEIFDLCRRAVPNETMGRLLGYRCRWNDKDYVKIVDWVSGTLESGATYAQLTPQGIRECELFLDERYGNCARRPFEVGLFHSHPFGTEPYFSATDYGTFLAFPYDQPGNVFVLIDPVSEFFKVFIVVELQDREKGLRQVPWVCYSPKVK